MLLARGLPLSVIPPWASVSLTPDLTASLTIGEHIVKGTGSDVIPKMWCARGLCMWEEKMPKNQPWAMMELPICSLTSAWLGVGRRLLSKFTSFQKATSMIRFSRPDHISLLPHPCARAHRSTPLIMCEATRTHQHMHICRGLKIDF